MEVSCARIQTGEELRFRPTVVRRILSHAVGDAKDRDLMSCGGRRRRRSGSALGRMCSAASGQESSTASGHA